MVGIQWAWGKPYSTARVKTDSCSANSSSETTKHIIQWMLYYAVRPGGMTGSGGRSQSINEVMQLTIPQLMFFCYERGVDAKTKSGEEVKRSISERYASDPKFRERYSNAVKLAKQRAKESLV